MFPNETRQPKPQDLLLRVMRVAKILAKVDSAAINPQDAPAQLSDSEGSDLNHAQKTQIQRSVVR